MNIKIFEPSVLIVGQRIRIEGGSQTAVGAITIITESEIHILNELNGRPVIWHHDQTKRDAEVDSTNDFGCYSQAYLVDNEDAWLAPAASSPPLQHHNYAGISLTADEIADADQLKAAALQRLWR